MVMDEEPKQQVQDVQIRIPGQDQTPFKPNIANVAKPASAPVASEKPTTPDQSEAPAAKPAGSGRQQAGGEAPGQGAGKAGRKAREKDREAGGKEN